MSERDKVNMVDPDVNGGLHPDNGTKIIMIGGMPMALGATCPKCGLDTRLDLGSTPFCQTCRCAGGLLQDGDCCSELDRL